MFGFKSTRDLLLEEQRKSQALNAELARATADLLYVSMMTGVDLDDYGTPEEEVGENA